MAGNHVNIVRDRLGTNYQLPEAVVVNATAYRERRVYSMASALEDALCELGVTETVSDPRLHLELDQIHNR